MELEPVVFFVGYTVMVIGAFIVIAGLLVGAALVSNKAQHKLLGSYGGWKVFLEYLDWYNNERGEQHGD